MSYLYLLFEENITVSSAEEQQSMYRLRKTFWDNFMSEPYTWAPEGLEDSDGTEPTTTYGGEPVPGTSTAAEVVDVEPVQRVKLTRKGYEPALEGLEADNARPLGSDFDAPLG